MPPKKKKKLLISYSRLTKKKSIDTDETKGTTIEDFLNWKFKELEKPCVVHYVMSKLS